LCQRTPSSSRRRPREFVVPSPPASTPRRVVLPHDRLKDPLADIMFGRTSSVSRISSVSSVSSRSSFFEPSSSRISISSSLEDEDEQDVHEEEEEEEGPPSNALFLERANARHRSDLDILLGSKSLRLASATLFDIIMPRASEIWNSKSIIFQTESWRWLRTFLDKAIDLEVAANIWCSDGAERDESCEISYVNRDLPPLSNSLTTSNTGTFDLSTIYMPSSKHREVSLGFEKMIDLISKHVEMSKRFRESGENNTILACLLESLTEFVRSVRARSARISVTHRITRYNT